MSEVIASILNIFTMLWVLYFATWLTATLSEQDINIFYRICLSIIKWDRSHLRIEKEKKIYLWCYIIIPALILTVLALSRQFRIGQIYIRPDLSFLAGALLWVGLPMFVIGLNNKSKK